ncbi:hypothetical protein D9M70_578110 [compost metagenome]
MLGGRGYERRGRGQEEPVTQHDIMGVRIGLRIAKHAIAVEVLIDAQQACVASLESLPQLVQRQPPECGIEALVLQNSPSGHEPITLCRAVQPPAKKNRTLGVLNHQIDGHQRSRCHHEAQGLVIQPHGCS